MSYRAVQISLEAVDSQGKSMLFKELVIQFRQIISKNTTDKRKLGTELGNLSKIIKRNTGLSITVDIDPSSDPSAYIFPPHVDKNNPVLTDLHRNIYTNNDGYDLIKANGSIIRGKVDRSKSRVDGVFKDLEVYMAVTAGLLKNRALNFSAEELAAIVIHEIGHVFTYLEYLGTGITTNYILQHATRSILDTRETERRYEIIKETEELLGIDIADKDALTRTEKNTTIQAVILREVALKRQSELNSDTYDLTAWEMLADQFATRHGAGRHITGALIKLGKAYGDSSLMSQEDFLKMEVLNGVLLAISGALTFGAVPILIFLLIDPTQQIYDKTQARLERVKRDLVAQIKENTTDPKYKKQLVEDAEAIDGMLKGIKDKRTFVENFWIAVRPKTRKNYNQTVFQQEMEKLTNNDLFVSSQKLKNV